MFRMEISEYDHIIQLFKGGGDQNRSSELSRTSCPSTLGGIWQTGFLFIGGRPVGGEGHYVPRLANSKASLISSVSQLKKNSSLKLFAKVT